MSKVLYKTRQWQEYSGQIRAEYYSRDFILIRLVIPRRRAPLQVGQSESFMARHRAGARVQCLAQDIGHSDTLPPEMQPGCPFDGATREAATYSSALPPPKLTYVCRLQFVPL